jgi:biopolymer transport protein ExbD
MARSNSRGSQEVNAGSMADIAFLLLIFFLVTTTIASDKGILNIYNVLINANNDLLVEGDYRRSAEGLDQDFKAFIMNFGAPDEEATALYNSLPASLQAQAQRKADSSDDPGEAVISIKTNRGTSYEVYLEVFDLAKKAYFEIYAERVGLTADEYRRLNGDSEATKALQDKGKEGIPMAISIAEPDKIGGN